MVTGTMAMLAYCQENNLTVEHVCRGGFFRFSTRQIAYNPKDQFAAFTLAHEIGHHLNWTTGKMDKLILACLNAIDEAKRAYAMHSVCSLYGVALPHIPKRQRRAYRKANDLNRYAKINLDEAIRIANESQEKQSEIAAWELGERFIDEQDRLAYWNHAKHCLSTYGVHIDEAAKASKRQGGFRKA